jgi:hypothetical protein
MSYDLQIWSTRCFEQSALGKSVRTSGSDWQVVINDSDRVETEDIEEEVSKLLPGIRYLTELNLEGNANAQAAKTLHVVARTIAKQTHGVVVDPQSSSIVTPAGVARFITPKKEKTFSVLEMSWWFLNDTMLKSNGRKAFLSLLEKTLPEALPKRYGDYEPPQHVFAETGISHLERCLAKKLDSVMVWHPTRPVTGLSVSCPKPLGSSEQGFRSNRVEIQVEVAALAQPGWAEQLQRFWRQLTFLLQPIYGEVRTKGGFIRSGGSVWVTPASIKSSYPLTTRSWFWRGIPRKLGHAVVLGKEYQRLWPDFVKAATMEQGFAFASTPDWSDDADLRQVVGAAPKAISLHPGEGMGLKQKYPEAWPFNPPFGQ